MGTHSGLLYDVPSRTARRALPWSTVPAIFLALLLGFVTLLPVLSRAASGWFSDPLRSIGVLLPIAAIVFLIRDVRTFSKSWKPTVSGLWFVAAACCVVMLHEFFVIRLHVGRSIPFDPLPVGIANSLMLAGMLLLVGGRQLLRACLFPVALVGITNPMPHFLNEPFDLPLQMASASAARGFAHLIHESPTGEQLQLMFSPNFGMFIAPGCNGIRGAMTLALLALFAAVWRRFRPWQAALCFCCGVAVGYLFNFLRLFVLVLYYKLGQSWHSIAPWGTQVDYVIGGCLFLLASFAFGSLIFQGDVSDGGNTIRVVRMSYPVQELLKPLLLFCLVCFVPATLNARTLWREAHHMRGATIAIGRLPSQNGPYRLVSEWYEPSEEGIPLYHWGSYTNHVTADTIALGIWLPPSDHDPRYSHAARGDILETLAPMEHTVAGVDTVTYSTYAYTDASGSKVVLASLSCPGCADRVLGVDHHVGPLHVISADPTNFFRGHPARSAVLVHTGPQEATYATLRRPLQQFLNDLDERALFQTTTNLQK